MLTLTETSVTSPDAQHTLEMLQRQDEEGMMWSLTCLEQMNVRLALSQDARDILHYFPPAAFIPALCGVLSREVSLLYFSSCPQPVEIATHLKCTRRHNAPQRQSPLKPSPRASAAPHHVDSAHSTVI